MIINTKSHDDWGTPKYLFDELNKEFNFDFDPCPMRSSFDGLKCDWGKSNFVNPPYSKKLKEAFVKKAFEESKKGSVCVCVFYL